MHNANEAVQVRVRGTLSQAWLTGTSHVPTDKVLGVSLPIRWGSFLSHKVTVRLK